MKLGDVRQLSNEMLVQEYHWSASDRPVSQHEADAQARTLEGLHAELVRRELQW